MTAELNVHRGRPTADELEARSPLGRSAHWLETRLLDLVHAFGLFYVSHERETLLDADCDTRVSDAITALDAGNGIAARALLLEYRERDALRDAEHNTQRSVIEQRAHAVVRRIGAAIERSMTKLRASR